MTVARRWCRLAWPTLRLFLPMAAPLNLLSYGENVYKGSNVDYTVHAEDSAIRKLPSLPQKKHMKKVDMMVIKVSKSGCVGSSKPCIHCLLQLKQKLPAKGYRLHNIYYTDMEGNIWQSTVSRLLRDEEVHISKYYKDRAYLYHV